MGGAKRRIYMMKWWNNLDYIIQDIIKIGISLTILVIFVVSLSVIIISRLIFPGEISKINSLRRDISVVSGIQANIVLEKAVKYNQKIKVYQTYNNIWWSDIFIPDGWENIESIDISKIDSVSEIRQVDNEV